jgi:hypothetical protein
MLTKDLVRGFRENNFIGGILDLNCSKGNILWTIVETELE